MRNQKVDYSKEDMENRDPVRGRHKLQKSRYGRLATRGARVEHVRNRSKSRPMLATLTKTQSKDIETTSNKIEMDDTMKDILNKFGAMPIPTLTDGQEDTKRSTSMASKRQLKKEIRQIQRKLALTNKKRNPYATNIKARSKPTKESFFSPKSLRCENLDSRSEDSDSENEMLPPRCAYSSTPFLATRSLRKELYDAVIIKATTDIQSVDCGIIKQSGTMSTEGTSTNTLMAPKSFKNSSLSYRGLELARNTKRHVVKKNDIPVEIETRDDISMMSSVKDDVSRSPKSEILSPYLLRATITEICSVSVRLLNKELNAALTIQCFVRLLLAVKLLSINKNARKIQASWRGFHVRRLEDWFNENATKIQSIWKTYGMRCDFLYHRGAIRIQTAWRSNYARQRFLHYQVATNAAIHIQTAWRGFSDYCEHEITIHCIVTIQRIVRGNAARIFYSVLSSRREKRRLYRSSAIIMQKSCKGFIARVKYLKIRQLGEMNSAATSIQTAFRYHFKRKRLCHWIEAVIKIQSFARLAINQIRYLSTIWCIIEIQSTMRGYLAKKKFQRIYKIHKSDVSATIIQAAWRRYDAQAEYKLHHGARLIQSTWRMYAVSKDFESYKKAQKIQSVWRCYYTRVRYQNTRIAIKAAIKIQAKWRGFVCQCNYIFTLMDIIAIQRIVRGYMGRRIYEQKNEHRDRVRAVGCLRQQSAITIQRVYRGFWGRIEYQAMLSEERDIFAAVIIQSAWRRYDAEQIYWCEVDCILLIQSVMRRALAGLKMTDRLVNTIISQSICRKWLACRRVENMFKTQDFLNGGKTEKLRESRGAQVLQLFYHVHVRKFVMNKHATKIQSFFRMVRSMVDLQILLAKKKRKERRRKRRKKQQQEEWDNMSVYSCQDTVATRDSFATYTSHTVIEENDTSFRLGENTGTRRDRRKGGPTRRLNMPNVIQESPSSQHFGSRLHGVRSQSPLKHAKRQPINPTRISNSPHRRMTPGKMQPPKPKQEYDSRGRTSIRSNSSIKKRINIKSDSPLRNKLLSSGGYPGPEAKNISNESNKKLTQKENSLRSKFLPSDIHSSNNSIRMNHEGLQTPPKLKQEYHSRGRKSIRSNSPMKKQINIRSNSPLRNKLLPSVAYPGIEAKNTSSESNGKNIRTESPLRKKLLSSVDYPSIPSSESWNSQTHNMGNNNPLKKQLNPPGRYADASNKQVKNTLLSGIKNSSKAMTPPRMSGIPPSILNRSRSRSRAEAFSSKSQDLLAHTRSRSTSRDPPDLKEQSNALTKITSKKYMF